MVGHLSFSSSLSLPLFTQVEMLSTNVLGTCMCTRAVLQVWGVGQSTGPWGFVTIGQA